MSHHTQKVGERMRLLSISSRVALLTSVSLSLSAAETSAPEPPAVLSRTVFDARGVNEAVLTVNRFGRYSIDVRSSQGTAVQIIDRMMGPGESDGEVAARDGRIDLFLDEGAYKVVARSHVKGQGTGKLSVHAFREANLPPPPLLIEGQSIDGRLDDYEQLSWWVQVTERKELFVEAQGRNLRDLRLWQDGSWLVDASPSVESREPTTGRPETACVLAADLQPGYYLVTAYGGAPNAWAKESDDHPFHLRCGIPCLPSAARVEQTVSPFGRDRFLAPKESDLFLLQLRDKKDFRLDLRFSDSLLDVIGSADAQAVINKKSQDPECLITAQCTKMRSVVTVLGAPGERYLLQVFQSRYSRTLPDSGTFWISTIHAGYLDDNIDATGILVKEDRSTRRLTVAASDVIHLGASSSWSRRFNLLGENTVFFCVDEPGDYEVRSTGTQALFKLEPFLVDLPPEYEAPEFQPTDSAFSLERGFYILTIRPQRQGILAVAVQTSGGLISGLLDKLMDREAPPPRPVHGSCQIGPVELERGYNYTLHVNTQYQVAHGLILRPYPPDLRDALPLTLQPGQELSVNFRVDEESRLRVMQPGKDAGTASVDGADCTAGCVVPAGTHTVALRNSTQRTRIYSVEATPLRFLPQAKPAYLPATALETLPSFPVITEREPLYTDYGRAERKTFVLRVQSPALYRVETTGLLKTACTIRTRTRTKLFSAEANGVGRNALVQQYLKEGEYQVSVETREQSAGHAGLQLKRSEVLDGGALSLAREAKASVPAGSAVRYSFTIPKEGTYSLETLGLGKRFRCRLEDADGWPIIQPGTEAALTREFAARTFGYMTLPLDVESLRVTRLEEVRPEREVEGRGPHTLGLNEPVKNIWRESAERTRDVYIFTLPAESEVLIGLGNDQMQALLKQGETLIETIAPDQTLTTSLPAGGYRLEVDCSRSNDYLPYRVLVETSSLVAGTSRALKAPVSLDVSVGREGIVELYSQGGADLRATLFHDDTLIDANDDSFNDWNFRITRGLAPGHYTLRVDPVATGSRETTVFMSAPEEVVRDAPTLPAELPIDLEGKINILPLSGEVLSLSVSSTSFAGCLLERVDPNHQRTVWHDVGREAAATVWLDPAGQYQLRLWSADHQSERVTLRVATASPATLDFKALTRGSGVELPGSSPKGFVVGRVRIPVNSTFRSTASPSRELLVASGMDHVFEPAGTDGIGLTAGDVLIRWPDGARRAALARVVLHEHGELLAQPQPGAPQWIDVENGSAPGPTVLIASTVRGRPACAVDPGDGSEPFLTGSYYTSSSSCVAVAPGLRTFRAVVAGTESAAVRVEHHRFAATTPRSIGFGSSGAVIPPRAAWTWEIPGGWKLLDLTLDRGLIAYTADAAGRALAVQWASDAPEAFSVPTEATRLGVINLADRPGQCSIAIQRLLEVRPDATLRPETPVERIAAQPGVIRLVVPEGLGGGTLRVRGAGVDRCEWVDARGLVHSGCDQPATSGRLTIHHRSGLVTAYIEAPGREQISRWGQGRVKGGAVEPLEAGSITALEGAERWYGITLDRPAVVRLRATGAAAIGIGQRLPGGLPPAVLAPHQSPGGADPFLAVGDGSPDVSLDRYLEAGSYLVGVRAIADHTLSGTFSYAVSPLTPIQGVSGPETFVGGGESQTFSFTVNEKSHIGIGIRTDGESVDCQLLRADENLIGRGIQQFVELDPGAYLLRVTLAPGEAPVRFTPYVVGLVPSGMGPPEEYLREFFSKIGLVEGEN